MPRSRQLAAIMFTDIEGYTALMQQSEEEAVRIRDRHRAVFNTLTENHNGRIIQYYGDGTLSIFNSAVEAVKCAVELQRQFQQAPKVPLRIGIHMGDIILTQDDIIGDSVNLASRIESLAIAGSVLISEKVLEEIKNKKGLPTRYMGRFYFKNDNRPRNIYAIDQNGLVVPKRGQLKGKTVKNAEKEPSKYWWISTRLQARVGALLLVLITIAGITWSRRQAKVEWARQVVLPELEQLANKREFRTAFAMALEAEKYIPNDKTLKASWPKFSTNFSMKSIPGGAKVFFRPYDSTNAEWDYLGITPIDSVLVPYGLYRWMVKKEGYHTLHYASQTFGIVRKEVMLHREDSIPPGMEWANNLNRSLYLAGLEHLKKELIRPFWIDKYEVTNQAYKGFVDAGGYENRRFWQQPFIKDGQEISFEEAMAHFTDKTGRRGPATWMVGNFPNGEEDFPVQGVSWYEAAAFAEFAGKSLPSVFHWNNAATPLLGYKIITKSNFNDQRAVPVGTYPGLGTFGTFDLAGNVREWCFNLNPSDGKRFILGGGWNDEIYAYTDANVLDPFDRSATNGFRCIKMVEPNVDQASLYRPLHLPFRNYYAEEPVDAKAFEIYIRQFAYDHTPLRAKVEYLPSENDNWNVEKIAFEAAYGKEEMIAYLFLPSNATPPFQPVIYFPGSNAIHSPQLHPDQDWTVLSVEFFMKSGRALLLPILKGTFERGDELDSDCPDTSHFYKEHVIMWVKDISRSIDYLETRDDIDSDKLAFYGLSWGAAMGGLVAAVETRIKTAVLHVAGLYFQPVFPEVDVFNYLPRVTIPVLMLNGEYDCFFPIRTSQKPLYDFLGTPAEHKRYIVHKSGHFVPRDRLIKETLDWLDKYQGKPGRHLN